MFFEAHKDCMYIYIYIYIEDGNIVKYYCNLKWLFSILYMIYSFDDIQQQPLLPSSVSRDLSEIILIYWFAAQ